MSDAMTYTRCSICGGSLLVLSESAICSDCPCTDTDTPGYSPTGLTLAQIERLVETKRALAGDPGLTHAKRGEVLADLHATLAKALKEWTDWVGL